MANAVAEKSSTTRVTAAWEWRTAARIPRRISGKDLFSIALGPLVPPKRIRERARRNPPSDSTVMQSLLAEEYQLKEKLELLRQRQKALYVRGNSFAMEWENYEKARWKEQEQARERELAEVLRQQQILQKRRHHEMLLQQKEAQLQKLQQEKKEQVQMEIERTIVAGELPPKKLSPQMPTQEQLEAEYRAQFLAQQALKAAPSVSAAIIAPIALQPAIPRPAAVAALSPVVLFLEPQPAPSPPFGH